MDAPHVILERLNEIERDLAFRQNTYERAAGEWYEAQREIGKIHAMKLASSTRATVAEKKAEADIAAYDVEGAAKEGEYKALRAVIEVLQLRASICQSILRSQGRV